MFCVYYMGFVFVNFLWYLNVLFGNWFFVVIGKVVCLWGRGENKLWKKGDRKGRKEMGKEEEGGKVDFYFLGNDFYSVKMMLG